MNYLKLISSVSFICFLIGHLAGTASAQNEGFSVYPRGLRVVAIPRAGELGMRPFNHPGGTTIVVQIESTDNYFVDYDRKSSQVIKYVDNVGTDLNGSYRGGKLQDSEIGNVKYSEDRRATMMELLGRGVPDSKATSIHIGAEMTFWIARKKVTHRLKNVSLISGQKIELGDNQITIIKAGPPQRGKQPLAVELKSENGLINFETIRFIDNSGNVIKSQRLGWSRGNFESAASAEYQLWQKLEMATIELEEWQEVEAIIIPLNVEAALGMSEYRLIESAVLKTELRNLIAENVPAASGDDQRAPNETEIDARVEEMITETRITAPDFLRVYPEDEQRFKKGEFDTEATRARWKSPIESSKVMQANFDIELPTLLKKLIAQNHTRPLVGIRLELATQLLEAENAKWSKRVWEEIEKE